MSDYKGYTTPPDIDWAEIIQVEKDFPLIEAATEVISQATQRGHLRMCIPVQQTDDDIVLMNCIKSLRDEIARLRQKSKSQPGAARHGDDAPFGLG